ncbi:MAG: peptidylprolyl isomerase [Pseudomonadales bacterium]|nr:peptidylprolyl isomerase [Pseudomonadales bacterium]
MPKQSATEQSVPVCIDAGARVTLHFSLALLDGSVIDSNYDKDAASFVVGDGSLLPGFEALLLGKSAGDRVRATIPAGQAFGEVNPDNIHSLPRQRFAGLLANTTDPLTAGTVLAFADGGGNSIPGVIVRVDEEVLVVDFNHPLAGRDIVFSADIITVIPAGVQSLKVQSR